MVNGHHRRQPSRHRPRPEVVPGGGADPPNGVPNRAPDALQRVPYRRVLQALGAEKERLVPARGEGRAARGAAGMDSATIGFFLAKTC